MEKLRAHVRGETEQEEKRKRTEWEEKGEGKRPVAMEAEMGVMQEQTKECQALRGATRSQKKQRLPSGTVRHPDCRLVAPRAGTE